jgi:hypothetical protein
VPQLSAFPSVFPVWWIAGTAGVGLVVSLLALMAYGHFRPELSVGRREAVVMSMLVGASIFAWRLSGNIPTLNDDPAGVLSPNDWLCPVVTYVVLGLYRGLRSPDHSPAWDRSRAIATIVSFAVNVVTI